VVATDHRAAQRWPSGFGSATAATTEATDCWDLVPWASSEKRWHTAPDAPAEVGWEGTVHVVIRHYRGNSQLLDELERRTDEVEQVIRGVSGFVAYYLVRTADGGFSVSVYEDRSGADESTRVAADWVGQNLPQLTVSPPEVIEGGVILRLST
jgi:hypothetical protein